MLIHWYGFKKKNVFSLYIKRLLRTEAVLYAILERFGTRKKIVINATYNRGTINFFFYRFEKKSPKTLEAL